MKSFWQGLTHLIAPRVCRICGCTLGADEEVMCLGCLMEMPRALIHQNDFNAIHQRLGHHCQVDRAAAWFYYKRDTQYARLLIDAKYGQLPALDRQLGEMCARELQPDGFFSDIEALVPMPIHWRKRMRRGYNQAMQICRGVRQVTGIEIADVLSAAKGHGVQARHGREQRYSSISGTLALRHPERVQGRRVLFVDDIITTGASASEAVLTLASGAPASISVLCLGLTTVNN
ncbi:MAG: hypothetical protein LUD17_08230 [Bacteroidales bacterium]|nr:hypothetical protein [Bacteroidales bacterium]